MKLGYYVVLYAIMAVFISSCSNKNQDSPKPALYPRIDKIKSDSARLFAAHSFSFSYPSSLIVNKIASPNSREVWFNIHYKPYGATLNCTYLPISAGRLNNLLEDNYRLVYSHVSVANAIEQKMYSDSINKIYGVIYDIKGNVATPLQFYVTDSTSHFLRGSLYYDNKVNLDSMSQATSYIRTDIVNIIESLHWNKP